MNKQGKRGISGLMWFVAIAVVALLGVLSYATLKNLDNSVTGPGINNDGQGTQIVTTGAAPDWGAQDRQAGGTSVGSTQTVRSTTGGIFNTKASSYTPGQVVDVFVTNNTIYHNMYVAQHKVAYGTSDPFTVSVDKNASVSESIYTTTGLVMTNSATATGAVQNQTNGGNGKTYNFKDEMSGTALQSTNDMTCVVEVSAGINVSTVSTAVTLNGNTPKLAGTPAWYTTAGVNSRTWLFDIPAITSGNTVTNTLSLTADTSKQFSAPASVKKVCYTKEWFIDPNTGQPTFDVADSNGAVKSMAAYTYQFYFQ
jgi:hypothetical protein